MWKHLKNRSCNSKLTLSGGETIKIYIHRRLRVNKFVLNELDLNQTKLVTDEDRLCEIQMRLFAQSTFCGIIKVLCTNTKEGMLI